MFRAYEQQRQSHHNHNQEVIGFESGINNGGISEYHHHVGDNSVHDGFDNEISGGVGEVEPCLALGSMDGRGSYKHSHNHHHQLQEQLFIHAEQQEQAETNHNYQHQHSPGSDEGTSLGPLSYN
ncbi:unnamed protein product [Linum trigynum]|uniref:Uncharacterized protein n=1 Tax=Linum trigynum TaxID=586398 RepID=A0AAV2E4T1_9ROSI